MLAFATKMLPTGAKERDTHTASPFMPTIAGQMLSLAQMDTGPS